MTTSSTPPRPAAAARPRTPSGQPYLRPGGDWLYMQAFQIALRERDFATLDLLIGLTQIMVEGELLQLDRIGRIDVSEPDCMELVDRKTARLFSVCARLGALTREAARPFRNVSASMPGTSAWPSSWWTTFSISPPRGTLGKPVGGTCGKARSPCPWSTPWSALRRRSAACPHRPRRPQLPDGSLRPHPRSAGEVPRHRARPRTRPGVHRQGPHAN